MTFQSCQSTWFQTLDSPWYHWVNLITYHDYKVVQTKSRPVNDPTQCKGIIPPTSAPITPPQTMGGDLGSLGDGPPKFEVEDGPCLRSPNISDFGNTFYIIITVHSV